MHCFKFVKLSFYCHLIKNVTHCIIVMHVDFFFFFQCSDCSTEWVHVPVQKAWAVWVCSGRCWPSEEMLQVCLFVSIPQLKLWGLLSVRCAGSMCNCFPTPLHTVIDTSAVLPVISGSCTVTSGIWIIEFAMSWRVQQLKINLTWDSLTQQKHYALR